MKARTIVLCAGKHSHVVVDILRLCGVCELVGILDDGESLQGTEHVGLRVIGRLDMLPELARAGRVEAAVLGLGNVRLLDRREAICADARRLGLELSPVIHPTACLSSGASYGVGLFAGPQVVVNTGTRLGDNVVLYTASSVDHDSVVEDHVFISPGVRAAGQVRIERGAYIGPGATIGSGCVVGANAMVGAGAVVLEDIPPGQVAFGIPARVRKSVAQWRSEHGGFP